MITVIAIHLNDSYLNVVEEALNNFNKTICLSETVLSFLKQNIDSLFSLWSPYYMSCFYGHTVILHSF